MMRNILAVGLVVVLFGVLYFYKDVYTGTEENTAMTAEEQIAAIDELYTQIDKNKKEEREKIKMEQEEKIVLQFEDEQDAEEEVEEDQDEALEKEAQVAMEERGEEVVISPEPVVAVATPVSVAPTVMARDITPEPEMEALDVKVWLYEYEIDFSKKTLPTGQPINFHVMNSGATSHHFGIEGVEDFGKVHKGETRVFQVCLPEGGYYDVYSSKNLDQPHDMVDSIEFVTVN